ncbi:MAG: hypothetical protein K2L64_03225, partial [Ureaplasma sp.]|nr:hypothetical protein [Ureaplasma sp.]
HIEEWNNNFDENLAEVITQIENYKNYKNYDLSKKKYKKAEWIYSDEDLEKIHTNLQVKTEINKFKEIVYSKRLEKINGK